jgi:hypothetical protein
MIAITINSKPVSWKYLAYHFQKHPKPGGGTYSIKVGREESFVIAYIEKMVGKTISDREFEDLAKKHWETTYNLVQYVLWKMEESSGQTIEQPLWVLNNIENVVVTNETLSITGLCSPFMS